LKTSLPIECTRYSPTGALPDAFQTSNGVGFQLGVYFQFFDIANILAYTASFVAVVMAVEAFAIRPLEQSLTRWRG